MPTRLIYSAQDFLKSTLQLISRAKISILISTFRFESCLNKKSKPLDAIYCALQEAHNRGADVFMLLNRFNEKERAGQENIKAARQLKKLGADLRRPQGTICNHAKLLISDENNLLLGSHNFSRHSLGENFEVSVLTDEFSLCSQATDIFWAAFHVAIPFEC